VLHLHQQSRPSHVRDQLGSLYTKWHVTPVGGPTTFQKRQLPRRSIIDFSFFLLYAIYLLYFVSYMASANLTSFQWQEGGALALTLSYVCIRGLLNLVTGSRILFRGKLALILFSCLFSLFVQFICSVYLFSLLVQLTWPVTIIQSIQGSSTL